MSTTTTPSAKSPRSPIILANVEQGDRISWCDRPGDRERIGVAGYITHLMSKTLIRVQTDNGGALVIELDASVKVLERANKPEVVVPATEPPVTVAAPNPPTAPSSAETRALLPCPFCGSSRLQRTPYWIRCNDCRAEGPSGDNPRVLWNKRYATVPTEPLTRAEEYAETANRG